ncbi:MAG TPA: hypothetical protein DCW90_20545 [Lachnospiraceae bacterium]|nr:flagellar protein FlaG [uncultured Lachnoclostridium sp.]HAU87785.1 hypothetical protein [Lachnospiraceae bacterium]
MLERVNGANPVNTSSTYSKQTGATVKSVSDNRQEMNNVVSDTTKSVDAKTSSADNERVKEAIEKLNSDIRFKRTGCEFTYHEECNRVSIKLYDTNTKEVIREIPSEDTIRMLEKLNELAGLMIDEKM